MSDRTGELSRHLFRHASCLVAAMNPCRCGKASDPGFVCRRGANIRCAADYQGRLSGPLLDRIDLHIEVPAVTAADLILPPPTEGSREVAVRVARAREMQAARYQALGFPDIRLNAQASGPALEGSQSSTAPASRSFVTRGRDAAVGARLPPRAAGRAYARRPRRSRDSWPRASGRSAVLSRARRRSQAAA